MIRKRTQLYLVVIPVVALVMAACQSAPVEEASEAPEQATVEAGSLTPAVSVIDQEINNGTVTIAEVISDGAGWLVVHAQADGKPGPILGFSPVLDGANQNIVVEIDEAGVTQTLYAMLHVDAGEVGTFEFPEGPDGPVVVDDKVVTPAFTISGTATLLNLAQDDNLGSFLIAEDGLSLYIFLNDEPGKSNCYDNCAVNWPPLLTKSEPLAGEGVDATLLGTTSRDDGTTQVTYNGWPLYYFVNDAGPGDVEGQNVFDVWFVIAPNGEYVKP